MHLGILNWPNWLFLSRASFILHSQQQHFPLWKYLTQVAPALPFKLQVPLSQTTFPTMGKLPLQAGLAVTHRSQQTPEPRTRDRKGTWSGTQNHSGEHCPATPKLQRSPWHLEMCMNVNWGGWELRQSGMFSFGNKKSETCQPKTSKWSTFLLQIMYLYIPWTFKCHKRLST